MSWLWRNRERLVKVHDEANRLLDIADTGDREAYKAALEDLKRREPALHQRASELAAWQYRMWSRSFRLFAWRSEWRNQRG